MSRVRDLIIGGARVLDGRAVEVKTSRSGGPGGQHVNKTETRVEVRIALTDFPLSPFELEWVRKRLVTRIDKEDRLFVVRDDSRSQLDNLEHCLDMIETLVNVAMIPEKPRKKTKPTRGSKERRLKQKRQTSERKKTRGRGHDD